jgi:hypothetical protein
MNRKPAVPERVLLFCVASGTDLPKAGITDRRDDHRHGGEGSGAAGAINIEALLDRVSVVRPYRMLRTSCGAVLLWACRPIGSP